MDFARYEFTLNCDHPSWVMDKRHVEVIYEFLMRNDFSRTCEIGSYTGYSTIAFIEALNHGKDFKFNISEPNPTHQLRALISLCTKPDNVILHTQQGVDVLEKWTNFDFVMVDGNHNIEGAGLELLMILRNGTPNVIAHDTNVSKRDAMNHPCLGSELLGRTLWSHVDYKCIEDKKQREGEKTDRGLFFATINEDTYQIAQEIFKDKC
jgi:predicted O-methyltransferase YrrM